MKNTLLIVSLLLATAPLSAKVRKTKERPPRFKPVLENAFYIGASGSFMGNGGDDVRRLLNPGYSASSGAGFLRQAHLGWQSSFGLGLEAGYEWADRFVMLDTPLYFNEYLNFAQRTWFVEPLYRTVFGRHFSLGIGAQLGLSEDKMTYQYTVYNSSLGEYEDATTDYTGHGWVAKPELRAQVFAAGIVGFEFNLGYRFADAAPIKNPSGFDLNDAGGKGGVWHAKNDGWTVGFGVNLYMGRVLSRPPKLGKTNRIPVSVEGSENLPPVREWKVELLGLDGTVVKTFEGEGPVPKGLDWNGLTGKGAVIEPGRELILRLSTVDSFGTKSVAETGYGDILKPRALQMASPLMAASEDGKGGLVIATQFKRNAPGVKGWKLKITDPSGVVLKTFEGAEVLPRSLKWNGLDKAGNRMDPKELRYSFEASDDEGPVFGEDGQVASAIKPRELMSKPPRYDAESASIVFMPETDVKIALKSWVLSLKAADGKVLKVISGEGPLPKEFRFKTEDLATTGVSLASSASGAAFIQYSLVTVDKNGMQSAASDALALGDEFGGEGGALSQGDYKVKRGEELLVLVKPNLLSPDPKIAARGSLLMSVPVPQGLKSWRLVAMEAGGRVVKEVKGEGKPPAMLLWNGLDQQGRQVDNPGSAQFALYASGEDGVEKHSADARPLNRSFKYEGKAVKVQRVHAAWFAQGESEIQPEMYGRLERVADWLNANKLAQVLLQGHSSKEGSASFNDRLALERATTVKRWLVDQKNVDELRVQIRSYGTRMLLDEGDSEDAVRRNRRIDVMLLEWPDE